MTYTQIDLFNEVNKVKLDNLFKNWKSEMEGLTQVKEFGSIEILSIINKFYQRGYIVGDFEIVNEFKTLFKRFDIEVELTKVSDHQWEMRMCDYVNSDDKLFVIKTSEDGCEEEYQDGNIKHALERYMALLDFGMTQEQLKLEVQTYNTETKDYELSYEFVVKIEGV